MSRGIDYDDATLKGIFNGCLDDPLPKWEMDNLKILDFWDFSRCLGHHIQWGMPLPSPKPACSNHSAPLPLSSQDLDTLLTPTQKRRTRRKGVLQSAASIMTPKPSQSPLSLLRSLVFPLSQSSQLMSSPRHPSQYQLFPSLLNQPQLSQR